MKVKLDVEPANYINLDLFPSTVSSLDDDQPIGIEFRVIVTDNHLYVIADSVDGPYLAVKEPLSSFDGTTKTGYTVNNYRIIKSVSCGCGTRLRGIHPFMGVPFQSQLK